MASANIKKEILSWGIMIVAVVLAALLIRLFLFEVVQVNQTSMEHTLVAGQRTILNRIGYRFSDPKRGDVINFFSETRQERLVKRIIALPGDTIRIENGITYVNGQAVEEPYAIPKPTDQYPQITLGADEYFVMGDNRPVSLDSRSQSIGLVSRSSIYGKVVAVIWPLSDLQFGGI